MRVLFRAFQISAAFVIIIIFIAFAQDVLAEDVENCFLCHKYNGLGIIDEEGKKHLDYVNAESYNNSVHQNIYCGECHNDIDQFPHPTAKKVNCATECHLVDPSNNKTFSHAKMIEEFNLSVHGVSKSCQHRENCEDLPTCIYCHQNRVHQPVVGVEEGFSGVAQEIMDRCLGCHENEEWTRFFYNHFTHRLHKRRSSKRMVALCSSCHEDEEKMKRHGLEVTGTYRDTFHWQAIKYGDTNAPNCITCHAPVGFFSHEIMPKNNPSSAVNKNNLISTCSNPSGLQQCHPNATASFAQGKVHPSGVKAKLLNIKLYGFKNNNQPKQGKPKTLSSLLAEKAQVELTKIDAYQANILWLIKLFYKCLIGGLISFMILHQILDYFATRREHKKEKH